MSNEFLSCRVRPLELDKTRRYSNTNSIDDWKKCMYKTTELGTLECKDKSVVEGRVRNGLLRHAAV